LKVVTAIFNIKLEEKATVATAAAAAAAEAGAGAQELRGLID
jgi:hypothetical protein